MENGKGIIHFKKGDKWVTKWKKGLLVDQGKYYFQEGIVKINHSLSLNNNIYFNNGDLYQGQLITKENQNGKGILYCQNGTVLDGEFGINEGKGTFYLNDGKKFVGNYINNELNGTLYFNNGDIYKGKLKDSKMEGIGSYYFKNGDKFIGLFKNSLREKGILNYSNGNQYIGTFTNEKNNGYGIYLINKNKYEGNGKII